MGYTHYWDIKRNFTGSEWNKFKAAAKKAAEISGVEIAGWDGNGTAEFSDSKVSFNGSAKLGEDYETFRVDRFNGGTVSEPKFGFCKTQYLPYDCVVCACLIILENVLGYGVSVSSDGRRYEENGWIKGAEIAKKALSKK